MILKLAMVDDDSEMLKFLDRQVDHFCRQELCTIKTEIFHKAYNLLSELETGNKFHLYLIDIEMPDMDGITLARKVQAQHPDSYIIFITGHRNYAVAGYEVDAYRYILKSRIKEKLPEALNSVMKVITDEDGDVYIIQNNVHYERISYKDIYYLYRDGKNVIFVTKQGRSSIRKGLGNVVKEMKGDSFSHIDRGMVINIIHIVSIKGNFIRLKNGEEFWASPSRLGKLKKQINEYWRERL